MIWKIISTAPNQITAESWCELLSNNGFECKIIDSTYFRYNGISNLPVRILVPEKEFSKAKNFLRETILNFDQI